MKKFVVLFVVAAFTFFGSMAYAIDVSVSGSIDIRSRDFNDLNLNKDSDNNAGGTGQHDTQERIRVNVDAKAGNDVKGRISIENDWDTWGRDEIPQGNGQSTTTLAGIPGLTRDTVISNFSVRPDIREAWISFNLPFAPVNITGGHQLLQLGNAWFYRSMKYGSDAWVVANVTGNNTVAFVDVKAFEAENSNIGVNVTRSLDIDAYVILDVFKVSDALTVGFDITLLHDRLGLLGGWAPMALAPQALGGTAMGSDLFNYSINANGKLGPVALKLQADWQTGDVDTTSGPQPKFEGKEIVLEGKVPMDPITIEFTAAAGSGNQKGNDNIKRYVNLLDADPHYTFLYEYKIKTAAVPSASAVPGSGAQSQSTGFSNTEALSIGAMWAISPAVQVGLDYWYLHATDAVSLNGAPESREIGNEVDVKFNWKLYDNLTWNWVAGYFAPGKAYDYGTGGTTTTHSADTATGIQGVLSFKF